MALIKCPECGRQISSQAPSCPYCGYPLESNRFDTIEIHNEAYERIEITTSDGRNYYISYIYGQKNIGHIEVYENGHWYFKCTMSSFFSEDIYTGKYFVVKGKRNKIKIEAKSEGFWHPFNYLKITEI